MYAQKIVQVRPTADVPFYGPETVALQDEFFKQRVEHPACVSSYASLSEDGLTYTRVTVYTDKEGYWNWFYDSSATRLFFDFSQSLKEHASTNGISFEVSLIEDVADESVFADMIKLDESKTLTENVAGLAL